MTRNASSSLGTLLCLWISLGLTTAAAQTSPRAPEINGVYDCSAPGFFRGKLIFLSAGRWLKSARFDPPALKMPWASENTRLYSNRRLFRDLGLRGTFSVVKDRVILYPLEREVETYRSGYSYLPLPLEQQFQIDPASGNLVEIPWWAVSFRSHLTCTRDGFF